MTELGSLDFINRAQTESGSKTRGVFGADDELKRAESTLGAEKVKSFEQIMNDELTKLSDSKRSNVIQSTNQKVTVALDQIEEEERKKLQNPMFKVYEAINRITHTPDRFDKDNSGLYPGTSD